MKLAELQEVASANLTRTYLALGQATDGTELIKDEGFTACISTTVHPICNFAIDLKLDPWAVRRLAAIAVERSTFFVYHTPNDEPSHGAELLDRAGFRRGYELRMMVAEHSIVGESVQLLPAQTMAERLDLAKFMTAQFFPRQNGAFRRLVATTTAAATELPLLSVWSGSQMVATLMLCEDETVGIYNLCVHPSHRGLGWGSSVVQAVQGMALSGGRRVTLQCEPRLEAWYKRIGFETIGTIGVYDLAETRRADIIEQ